MTVVLSVLPRMAPLSCTNIALGIPSIFVRMILETYFWLVKIDFPVFINFHKCFAAMCTSIIIMHYYIYIFYFIYVILFVYMYIVQNMLRCKWNKRRRRDLWNCQHAISHKYSYYKNLKSEIRSKLMKKYGAKFVRVSIWFDVFLTTMAYFCVSCYSVVACK